MPAVPRCAPLMNILVVGPSWVGDTVISQVLLQLLKQQQPAAKIDYLAPPWTLPLLQRMPEVRQGILNPFGHGALQLGERRRLGLELRAGNYDQALVLPNSWKSALPPWFAGIPRRTGFRGEARWGLLNDLRTLDPQALPQMADRFAALAFPAPPCIPPPDNSSSYWQDWALIPHDPRSRSVRGLNTVLPNAGPKNISPRWPGCWPHAATPSGWSAPPRITRSRKPLRRMRGAFAPTSAAKPISPKPPTCSPPRNWW